MANIQYPPVIVVDEAFDKENKIVITDNAGVCTLSDYTTDTIFAALRNYAVGIDDGDSPYDITEDQPWILASTANGNITVAIPDSLLALFRLLLVANVGHGVVTIDPEGATLINGQATYTVDNYLETVLIVNNGTTGWFAVSIISTKAGDVFSTTIINTDSPYTITTRNAIFANAAGGAITVNMPVATGEQRMMMVIKTDASANVVTIKDSGGTTIFELTDQRQSVQFITDGSDWYAL
jgi:hypothetical protein